MRQMVLRSGCSIQGWAQSLPKVSLIRQEWVGGSTAMTLSRRAVQHRTTHQPDTTTRYGRSAIGVAVVSLGTAVLGVVLAVPASAQGAELAVDQQTVTGPGTEILGLAPSAFIWLFSGLVALLVGGFAARRFGGTTTAPKPAAVGITSSPTSPPSPPLSGVRPVAGKDPYLNGASK